MHTWFIRLIVFKLVIINLVEINTAAKGKKGGKPNDEETGNYFKINKQSSLEQESPPVCDKPPPPMNGEMYCQSMRDGKVCKAYCLEGYRFPDGSSEMMTECFTHSNKWIPYNKFPSCTAGSSMKHDAMTGSNIKHDIMTGNNYQQHQSIGISCSQPDSPISGRVDCVSDSQFLRCLGRCFHGYYFPDGTSQMQLICNKDNGEWSPKHSFPICSTQKISCPKLDSPIPGNYKCKGTSYIKTCTGYCSSGYYFPDGSYEITLTCVHENGISSWSPYTKFPHCQRLNLCKQPPTPSNGNLQCHSRQNSMECIAECNAGYKFDNGNDRLNLYCDISDGIWKPAPTFPDCIVSCNPECQNGGVCSNHNTCICPKGYRGNSCQYHESNCDKRRLMFSGDVKCQHYVNETLCQLKCPLGMAFRTSFNPPLIRCNLEGLWTPQNIPTCIEESELTRNDDQLEQSDFNQEQNELIINDQQNQVTPDNQWIYITNDPKEEENNDIQLQLFHPPSSKSTDVCSVWSTFHYRTFDGFLFDFPGTCSYVLTQDCSMNTFTIILEHNENCINRRVTMNTQCFRTLRIEISEETYHIYAGPNGTEILKDGLSISKIDEITLMHVSRYIVVTIYQDITLWIDGTDAIYIIASSAFKNSLCGLCGNYDGNYKNDLINPDGNLITNPITFANSWKKEDKRACQDVLKELNFCHHNTEKEDKISKTSAEKCLALTDKEYEYCHKLVDPHLYLEACKVDCCDQGGRDGCECSSLSEYFRECARLYKGKITAWRKPALCYIKCENGTEYQDCGSACPKTCENLEPVCLIKTCVDGCHCPQGMVLHENHCVLRSECPCEHNNQWYANGDKLQIECNMCVCESGKWKCTKEICPAICSSVGDSHFVTFDGKRYEFIGHCSYYLVNNNDGYIIEQDNSMCIGDLNTYNKANEKETVSCKKSITLRTPQGTIVKMKQGMEIIVNGKEIESLPHLAPGVLIRQLTSLYQKAEMANGLNIIWDGWNRIYVIASSTLFGKTSGLCGTFNHNQADDFLTTAGDVESSINFFAEKWKITNGCTDYVPHNALVSSACDTHPERKISGENVCSKIKNEVFKACHAQVDPTPYYEACMHDVCACKLEMSLCFCSSLADYAFICARHNVTIDWRPHVPSCGVYCMESQHYQICSDSCEYSCYQLSTQSNCEKECFEGCSCSPGESLDSNGVCISISKCPCIYHNKEYPPNFTQLRGIEICTCLKGQWQCHLSVGEEIATTSASEIQSLCSSADHKEYTDCVSLCPLTCQNFHEAPSCTVSVCKSGCRCQQGYILNEDTGICVKPNNCPCHHGKHNYKEKETIKINCRNCVCKAGRWICDETACPGICSTWGNSHFITFDGHFYDFQGTCDYVLVKGKIDETNTFSIIIRNELCGTGGISCSKSITFIIGDDRLMLFKNIPLLYKQLSSQFNVKEVGMFLHVSTDIGISIQWDKKTRIYIRAQPIWMNKLEGLCGDFNGDSVDDFKQPSGDIPATDIIDFTNSWKVHLYCQKPTLLSDSCSFHSERYNWANKKCTILKSLLFNNCHEEVNVEPFYKSCIFDACGCDMGGDCECICTSIAAYAYECARHGILIYWRSQELCPIQCEECERYSPCVSPCPLQTCESQKNNISLEKIEMEEVLCQEEPCAEGCERISCPPGKIYNNPNELKCIPLEECGFERKICKSINGQIYYEGEHINDTEISDPCQSCYCIKGEISCVGQPCLTTTFEFDSQVYNFSEDQCHYTGWSPWINSFTPNVTNGGDFEELNNISSLFWKKFDLCPLEKISNIKCQPVGSKSTEIQNITCSLPFGLICLNKNQKLNSLCYDYEIQVYCNCDCAYPRGMESGKIQDDQISASSAQRTGKPFKARLNSDWAWYPQQISPDEWIQVDLLKLEEITGIKIQGGASGLSQLRILQVLHSVNGQQFNYLTNTGGQIVNFTVPELNKNEIETIMFPSKIIAQFIRLKPLTWKYNIAVRFEILGCDHVVSKVPKIKCGMWSPWLNLDNPYDDGNDYEVVQQIPNFKEMCPFIIAMQCRSAITKQPIDSSIPNLVQTCRKGKLICKSSSTHQCEDYEVKVFCKCKKRPKDVIISTFSPTIASSINLTSTAIPILTATISNESIYTIIAPSEPISPCPSGFEWQQCKIHCDFTCSSFKNNLISQDKCLGENKCIPGCSNVTCLFPKVLRDYYTCVSLQECPCQIGNGTLISPGKIFYDKCEKCQCLNDRLICLTMKNCLSNLTSTITPSIEVTEIESIIGDDCWTKWINLDDPTSGGGDFEELNVISTKYNICSNPIEIQCRNAITKRDAKDDNENVKCDKNIGLQCWNTKTVCSDYEVRFFCSCSNINQTLFEEEITRATQISCQQGWTKFFNNHITDDIGDFDTLQLVQKNYGIICFGGTINSVRCYTNHTMLPHDQAGQRFVICNLQKGLLCENSKQLNEEKCFDYQISFYCDCFKQTTEEFSSSKLPSIFSTESEEEEEEEGIPFEETEIFHSTLAPCAYWSDWININSPLNNIGDFENVTPLDLKMKYHFCNKGEITDIECKDVKFKQDYRLNKQIDVTCTLEAGLKCWNEKQKFGLCSDYMIRYFCSCEKPLFTTIAYTVSLPPVITECFDYIPLIDGEFPLSDSNLKASSSLNSKSGPQNIRLSALSSDYSAGAWIPGILKNNQYIEIDLNEPRIIYGIITKGREGYSSWVTSYYLLYSIDGISYSIYEDMHNSNKLLSGNYDSTNSVQHILDMPFEAQYIRIQPNTWIGQIALRAEILGCSEEAENVVGSHKHECLDPMGLENGLLADAQLSSSSLHDWNHGAEEARIGKKGWVSGILNDKQYLQINFLEPRNISAILTQGREEIEQWVTAYSVSYSNDGKIWNAILDEKGNEQIFPGNFNSKDQATVYLPQILRTQYIRIIPKKWNNWISMKLEILGCFHSYLTLPTTTVTEFVLAKEVTKVEPPYICREPMGLRDNLLPDDLIYVSSSVANSDSSRLRLNTIAENGRTGGWVPGMEDQNPYAQIDFIKPSTLTGIITQGLYESDEWIKSYSIFISNDTINWKPVLSLNNTYVFKGNNDHNNLKYNDFSKPVIGRYLRLNIISWHNHPSLRMEVVGCYHSYETSPGIPITSTTISYYKETETIPEETNLITNVTNECIKYGPWLSLSDPSLPTSIGDFENIQDIISASNICQNPIDIECRDYVTHQSYKTIGQEVSCDLTNGLYCLNKNQKEEYCSNYEVRIKCWICIQEERRKFHLPLCPELPEYMAKNCPITCPTQFLCNGTACVDPVNCICVQDDKVFKIGELVENNHCQQCNCIIGGHSVCTTKSCSTCSNGQISKLLSNCSCSCENCKENEALCISSNECILKEKWCDGIVDCPDDEINCLTTPTTRETVPIISPEDIGSCEILGKQIRTYDGQEFEYDICDHILLKDAIYNNFNVTGQKICDLQNPLRCHLKYVIYHDETVIEINNDIYITINGHNYTASQLALFNKKNYNITIEVFGNHVRVKSQIYNFTVIQNKQAHLRIESPSEMMEKLLGLCGHYNGIITDDKKKPDGKIAATSKEFGDSWKVNSEKYCLPSYCPIEIKEKVLKACNRLRESPFDQCADVLNIEIYVKACISSACDCMKQNTNSSLNCECDIFLPLLEACEKKLKHPLPNWRIKFGCNAYCNPGLVWEDCGPACQLTCYNFKDVSCSEQCVPGCFCPSGTVLDGDVCKSPEMCSNTQCQGFGDPHFETFDELYYPFQAVGKFILATDKMRSFVIVGEIDKCFFNSNISCMLGLNISYNNSMIKIRKGKELIIGTEFIKMEMLPIELNGMTIFGYPGQTFLIIIPNLGIEIKYYEFTGGFSIKIPSERFFNNTRGLCGNCNKNNSDEMIPQNNVVVNNVADFVCSWLEDGDIEDCISSFHEKYISKENLHEDCTEILDPMFKACHMIVDPILYQTACIYDIANSDDYHSTICNSLMEYAKQCCSAGISVQDWYKKYNCNFPCPNGTFYQHCHNACPQTCHSNSTSVDCHKLKIDGCFCPENMILKNGLCVEKLYCNTCDENGHLPGDVWSEEECSVCSCTDKFRIECRKQICPSPPICKENEHLKKLTTNDSSCCKIFACEALPDSFYNESCPTMEIPICKKGESVKLVTNGNCLNYTCECEPVLCPALINPSELKPGQKTEIVKYGCCPEIQVVCKKELCPPVLSCPPHLELEEYNGECCPIYQCEKPKDKCIYTHEYEIDEKGYEYLIPLDELQISIYQPNETWSDGLCRTCICKYNYNHYSSQCIVQQCPDIYNMPENMDYEILDLYQPNQCCAELFYVSCKDEDGKTHEIGDQWHNKTDPCQIYECALSLNSQALKTVRKEECGCEKGEEEQLPSENECCGKCLKTHCVHFDTLYSLNEKWNNPFDICQKYECKLIDDELSVVKKTCLPIPDDCPEENIIMDEDGCCALCNATYNVVRCNSLPKSIDIGELKKRDSIHGLCVNKENLSDILECSGICESHAMYSLESQEYKSSCKCCKPVDIEINNVKLACEDGYQLTLQLEQPKACACYPCSGSENDKYARIDNEENNPQNLQETLVQNNQQEYTQNNLQQEDYVQNNLQEDYVQNAQNNFQDYNLEKQ